MKVVCFDKIINLDKFESVQYRTSVWGDCYPVEAIKYETSGEYATEEIARFPHECTAKALVNAITYSWLANEQVFDVDLWKFRKAPYYTPTLEPIPLANEQKNQETILNQIKECEENGI